MEGRPASSWPGGPPGRWVGVALLLSVVLLVAVAPPFLRQSARRGPPAPAARETPAPGASATVRPSPVPPVSIYREAIVGSIATLNPLLTTTDAEADVAALLFAGLTRTDGRGGATPDLAERWAISPDGKTYTVTLRREATWHDGKPVTSRDVLFTVRLMQESHFPANRVQSSLWRTVVVDVLDPATVRFTLSEAFAPFLGRLAFPLLPAHLLHGVFAGDLAAHDFSLKPVGAGPYRLLGDARQPEVQLQRHTGYHLGQPRIDRLMLRLVPTIDEALADLRDGGVDGVAGIPGERLDEVRGMAGVRVQAPLTNGYTTLILNLRRALFQQREVRQAFALAIDRPALIRAAMEGEAEPLAGPIMSTSWAYQPAASTGSIHEARALLERAGWMLGANKTVREREGRALAFTMLTSQSPQRSRAAAELARQLGEIGVRVTVVTLPPDEIVLRHLAPRDFDAVLFGWMALGDDPDPYGQWHSSQAEQGYNFAGWSQPRADELLEVGRTVVDRAERRARYVSFQQVFAEEAPSIVLYAPRYLMATATRVQTGDLGPINRPADRFRAVAGWTIESVRAVG
jgi:peptide/nickel transport system substrate-binding protein